MKSETHNPIQAPTLRSVAKFIALNGFAWLAFTALAALTSLNDDLRAGLSPDYWEIFIVWSQSSIALAILSWLIYACLSRWPRSISSGRNIVFGYGVLLLFLLPLQLIFVIKLILTEGNHSTALTWEAIQTQILVIDRYSCLLRLSTITAVYFVVVIIKIWQNNQEREKAWSLERAATLRLKLELEEQKMLTLRAQLEPHFVFNALNAISALVLSDNKRNALDGISGLSELLRYALTASEQTWVKFAQELSFVDDYLRLQKLRYGERLHVHIEGVNPTIKDADCPPLLLQPLIENALRHDLDCHEDSSDIHVRFSADSSRLHIVVSNPLHSEHAVNPGTGLGLANIRARLHLAYGDAASLVTHTAQKRFFVELRFPFFKDR